jgi:hypothetical protein
MTDDGVLLDRSAIEDCTGAEPSNGPAVRWLLVVHPSQWLLVVRPSR